MFVNLAKEAGASTGQLVVSSECAACLYGLGCSAEVAGVAAVVLSVVVRAALEAWRERVRVRKEGAK